MTAPLAEPEAARSPIRYGRLLLKLSGQAQWGILLGLYGGHYLLRMAAQGNPALAPWVTPLLVAYGLFALMTWIARPLFACRIWITRSCTAGLLHSPTWLTSPAWKGVSVAPGAL